MMPMIAPYLVSFALALAATLALTPIVREVNRRLGMVDKPDPRRINKVPIPRGGGVAIAIGVFGTYALFAAFSGRQPLQGVPDATFWKLTALSFAISAVGLVDDRFSLPPKVKLAGQAAVALATWWWAGLGFADIWPVMPAALDCAITVLWILGAVNAFNLIDGLDGLAAGLALIATVGMAGALIFSGRPNTTLFYFAFAGGLLGFLRYNYNPATVFLGDSGSMLLGFVVAVLPLCSHAPNSFLVSVGVPLLAMGVPIFDTSLAILRRSLRHLLGNGGNDSGKVMTADADHIHHRILRAVGLNQRKAAWALYALAAFLVTVGLVGMALKSRAAGLWLVALTVALVVMFRDMARVELFDAGLLLGNLARARTTALRRKVARLATPMYMVADVAVVTLAFLTVQRAVSGGVDRRAIMTLLPLRVTAVFFFLVFFRTYGTVWSRAMLSNYLRLALACAFGSVAASAVAYYLPGISTHSVVAATLLYATLSLFGLIGIRILRSLVRDVFYTIDSARLVARSDVSRVLVYGAGLRYRAFRRELVRTTAANRRVIVGLLDDDILLRGHFIGGIQVMGTLMEAPDIINRLHVDAVVVSCMVSEAWIKVVRETLAPTGVKITIFSFEEREA